MVIKKSKATNPSWGGRFEGSVNELAVSCTSSLDQDKGMYKEDIVGSMKYSKLIEKDAVSLIKPEEAIRNKDSIGGTSPKQVLRQINNAKRELNLRR